MPKFFRELRSPLVGGNVIRTEVSHIDENDPGGAECGVGHGPRRQLAGTELEHAARRLSANLPIALDVGARGVNHSCRHR